MELVAKHSPVAKTVIHHSDFGHDGINASKERCGICLNPSHNSVVVLVVLNNVGEGLVVVIVVVLVLGVFASFSIVAIVVPILGVLASFGSVVVGVLAIFGVVAVIILVLGKRFCCQRCSAFD
jgi:hypothetical protein